ncbi:MAG: hypothetical protein Q9227_003841 [Pyrenula ochraceoflavens]
MVEIFVADSPAEILPPHVKYTATEENSRHQESVKTPCERDVFNRNDPPNIGLDPNNPKDQMPTRIAGINKCDAEEHMLTVIGPPQIAELNKLLSRFLDERCVPGDQTFSDMRGRLLLEKLMGQLSVYHPGLFHHLDLNDGSELTTTRLMVRVLLNKQQANRRASYRRASKSETKGAHLQLGDDQHAYVPSRELPPAISKSDTDFICGDSKRMSVERTQQISSEEDEALRGPWIQAAVDSYTRQNPDRAPLTYTLSGNGLPLKEGEFGEETEDVRIESKRTIIRCFSSAKASPKYITIETVNIQVFDVMGKYLIAWKMAPQSLFAMEEFLGARSTKIEWKSYWSNLLDMILDSASSEAELYRRIEHSEVWVEGKVARELCKFVSLQNMRRYFTGMCDDEYSLDMNILVFLREERLLEMTEKEEATSTKVEVP